MRTPRQHLSLGAARLLVTLLRLDTDGDGMLEVSGTLHWQEARIWPGRGFDPYQVEAELEARGEILRLAAGDSGRTVYLLRKRLEEQGIAA
jgi:hypothetical protein